MAQQIGLDGKHRQLLVQIIMQIPRDAAALVFLRGDQLAADFARRLFDLLALSDINRDAHQPQRTAVGYLFHAPACRNPTHSSARQQQTMVHVERTMLVEGIDNGLVHRLAIFGMHAFHQRIEPEVLVWGVSVDLLPFRARPDVHVRRVPNPHSQVRRVGGQRHALLAFVQFRLRREPLRNIDN